MSELSRIGIVARGDSPDAARLAFELAQWLLRRGRSVALDPDTATAVSFSGPEYLPSEEYDLVVVLGGDGTLLGAARNLAGRAPLLSVNLGRMGFLTELKRSELYAVLGHVLGGKFGIEERSLLDVELHRAAGSVATYRALNDAVVAKNAVAKIIDLTVRIDDQLVARFRGDGLIVSTPTGSTAYNLSAGGPIVDPGLPVLVLTPICPHSLALRPLVVPDTGVLDIETETRPEDGVVFLALDGQEGAEVVPGDRIRLTRSPSKVRLVKVSGRNFHDNLREKLGWGGLDDSVHSAP